MQHRECPLKKGQDRDTYTKSSVQWPGNTEHIISLMQPEREVSCTAYSKEQLEAMYKYSYGYMPAVYICTRQTKSVKEQ